MLLNPALLSRPLKTRYWHWLVLGALVYFWLRSVLLHAKVALDAYTSFRYVDNFVNGFGLRYNIDERVQGFTNPLWTLLHIPLHAISPYIVISTLIISIACAILSLLVLMRTFRLHPVMAAAFCVVPFYLSKTFNRNYISGLENPLTGLTFLCFGYVLHRTDLKHRWFWLCFTVSLCLLNRMDTAVALAPVMLYLLYVERKHIPWKPIILGALPFIAWCVFSLIYYGFLLPNTLYAKLYTGMPLRRYLYFGFGYMNELLFSDLVMSVLIISTSCYVIYRFTKAYKDRTARDMPVLMLGAGMIAYLAYTVYVGGSFISCRMTILPALMAMWIVFTRIHDVPFAKSAAGAVCVCIAAGLLRAPVYHPLWHEWRQPYRTHVGDILARPALHVLKKLPGKQCEERRVLKVKFPGDAGIEGYMGGPCIHISDSPGLTDPLLARMKSYFMPRTGHAYRVPPKGYANAIMTGNVELMRPGIGEYYSKLRLIIAGDIWDLKRMETIVRFNLGEYNHLIGR